MGEDRKNEMSWTKVMPQRIAPIECFSACFPDPPHLTLPNFVMLGLTAQEHWRFQAVDCAIEGRRKDAAKML